MWLYNISDVLFCNKQNTSRNELKVNLMLIMFAICFSAFKVQMESLHITPDKAFNVWFELNICKYYPWLMAAFVSTIYTVYFTLTIIPVPVTVLNRTIYKKQQQFKYISLQASIQFHKEKRLKQTQVSFEEFIVLTFETKSIITG